ncbi:MAG: dTDP-4-dehydrorhamnose reductase [Deltaproteobacteria bacterium]|nr:dTDP-4-dehydrorhamnose reductase [Deltaproteobacteria bacterium]
MRLLVVGSSGMLARDVIRQFKGTCELFECDYPHFDLCDQPLVMREVASIRPDVIINCAAYTDVDGCENEKARAFAVNADGVRNLALACKETGSRLVHVSTDFVFDGNKNTPYDEDDLTNPLSVYGSSKLAGEAHIREVLERYVIVRTSWLFGKGGNNFVETIKRLAGERDELRIVDDQKGCPTFAADLAQALSALISSSAQGVFHVSNSGPCTWYEFGRKIVELSSLAARVTPVSSDEFPRPARRPANSVMNTQKYYDQTGKQLRPWQEALQDYFRMS